MFKAFIRCMKFAFYRPDFQIFLISLLIKRLSGAFASKYATEPLKNSFELSKHSAGLLKAEEKSKYSAESFESSTVHLKNSSACLCYNTASAVPISHSIKQNSYQTKQQRRKVMGITFDDKLDFFKLEFYQHYQKGNYKSQCPYQSQEYMIPEQNTFLTSFFMIYQLF